MSKFFKKLGANLQTTVGFFCLSAFLIWLKTYIVYQTDFTLGAQGPLQHFLLILNPIGTTLLLLGIALYFRGRVAYWLMILINLLESIWIFSNVLYYREFSDFLSVAIIGSASSVDNNLNKAIGGIIHLGDFFVFVDIIVLVLLLLFKVIKIDKRKIKKRFALSITALSFFLIFADFGISNADRSGLLTRTFDNNYIVKYLGLNEYLAFNIFQTHKQEASRSAASAKDIKPILKFIDSHQAPDNVQYFGKAKGKNVFVIHLESLQQFMIGYKWDGQEVMPNLTKFYHDQSTMSFDNFYNQVGQGKTSDAETMLENSLYGLPSGSAMVNYGTSNTFQAAPAILSQQGYTTASFHGDVASFWNRDNAYKSWGYDYFFSKPFYKDADNPNYNVGYGMKDKIFLQDTAQYIQQLPQPFYAKVITVTNHYPYDLDKQNQTIKPFNTGDNTVDGYVQTAHYLDQAFGEFLAWLKASGLYNNSMIVLYGDHYGISDNHRPAIAKLLNKPEVTNADLANFQKVPFMIHMPGLKGGINHTYGGEIDVLPTLFDLLGVKDDNYVQFGTDLLSPKHISIVPFRDGDFVTPQYIKYQNQYFYTQTGKQIDFSKDPAAKQAIAKIQDYVDTSLSDSDKVITGDLLRFYTPAGFKKVNRKDYNYNPAKTKAALKQDLVSEPSSIFARNHDKSLVDLYKTDAPELKKDAK
ncbi:LTA synthase family protein [Periweissella ghanensis]|uniref:Lipoteichoic acid synthase 1 n=1 Tax=Periweissella ghanensis TaxID=467997 RepID=A0ABM8ZCN2_9LACO|nr:LTA synthase family protein [Periweissella ghanensis]MCM0601587.1 LTA synthase family protein [Periweissella ghanensis]CAH0418664.1 Lipoteichoic acid synthase 1 [Periweissella ghanensis]